MSRYLEEAAQLLRKASETNEFKNARYESFLNQHRLEIADAFARLAAIEKGLLPLDMLPEILKRAEVSQ